MAEQGDAKSVVNMNNARAKCRSPVWQYVGFRDNTNDKQQTTCKLCFTNVSYKVVNTSDMATHLRHKHSITIEDKKRFHQYLMTKFKSCHLFCLLCSVGSYRKESYCVLKPWYIHIKVISIASKERRIGAAVSALASHNATEIWFSAWELWDGMIVTI